VGEPPWNCSSEMAPTVVSCPSTRIKPAPQPTRHPSNSANSVIQDELTSQKVLGLRSQCSGFRDYPHVPRSHTSIPAARELPAFSRAEAGLHALLPSLIAFRLPRLWEKVLRLQDASPWSRERGSGGCAPLLKSAGSSLLEAQPWGSGGMTLALALALTLALAPSASPMVPWGSPRPLPPTPPTFFYRPLRLPRLARPTSARGSSSRAEGLLCL